MEQFVKKSDISCYKYALVLGFLAIASMQIAVNLYMIQSIEQIKDDVAIGFNGAVLEGNTFKRAKKDVSVSMKFFEKRTSACL